jgi:hypothetical protein
MADEVKSPRSTISEAIKDLELWGYVRREQHQKDKRRKVLRVSYGLEIVSATADIERYVGTYRHSYVDTIARKPLGIRGTDSYYIPNYIPFRGTRRLGFTLWP